MAERMHIDDFIEDFKSDAYAAFVFNYFRLPAGMSARWWPFMKSHKLFCSYEGKRYRVTGASRLGDVWLTTDFKQDTGYEERVDVARCGAWGPKP